MIFFRKLSFINILIQEVVTKLTVYLYVFFVLTHGHGLVQKRVDQLCCYFPNLKIVFKGAYCGLYNVVQYDMRSRISLNVEAVQR